MVGSGLEAPCKHKAMFTLQPNEVLTALVERPRLWKSFANDVVKENLGRSSATTIQVLTQLKLTFRC